mgnify:CR=1 FL=1
MSKKRKTIDSIRVGTWEAKNIKCPPANKAGPQEFFTLIRKEEAGPSPKYITSIIKSKHEMNPTVKGDKDDE